MASTLRTRGVLAGIVLVSMFSISGVHGAGFVGEHEIRARPSAVPKQEAGPINFTYMLRCYDGDTGGLLDCPFTLKVLGLKNPSDSAENNGGHNHDFASHPIIFPADGALEYRGDKYAPNPGIVDSTRNEIAVVTYPMPEVAGRVLVETFVFTPVGWFCVDSCFTSHSWKDLDALDVRVPVDLVELPPASFYVRCGSSSNCFGDSPGSDSRHPRPHFGRLELIGKVIGLAAMYRSRFSAGPNAERLRILDISLERGGLFDTTIPTNPPPWTPTHTVHRHGVSVDISRRALTDSGGTPFVNQDMLDILIEQAGLNRYTETKKEECPALAGGGNPCIHIDL